MASSVLFFNTISCFLLVGIRGEINVVVKVDLFNDLNRFRQSSCGVKFFCSKYRKKRKTKFFFPSFFTDCFPPLASSLCKPTVDYVDSSSKYRKYV